MSPHSLHGTGEGDAAHREAQEALPWLANGTLGGTELERVQAHVKTCAACRTELASLHTLRAVGPGPAPQFDVDGALARLLPQLDVPALPGAPLPVARGWRARLAANDARWLRVAVAAQCCAIAVLGALLLHPADRIDAEAGAYRVLGAGQGKGAALVVTFKPDTPERELRRIVLAGGARIVGGPTVTGAWLLGTDEVPAALAARLRTEPAVVLAEPLAQEARP